MSNRVGPWAPLNPHLAPPGRHWKNFEKKGGAAAIRAIPQQEQCLGVRLLEDDGESDFYCGKIVRALYLYAPHCTISTASIQQGRHPREREKVAVTVCVTLRILPRVPAPKTHTHMHTHTHTHTRISQNRHKHTKPKYRYPKNTHVQK